MVHSCYLCDRKASKADNISLHKFPKNAELRTKWSNTCELTKNDDLNRVYICSRHFRTDDICQSNIFGKVKTCIKRDAVPTLFLTNPLNIEESNKLLTRTPLLELFDENIVANQFSSNVSGDDIENDSIIFNVMQKSSETNDELKNVEVQTSNRSSINTSVSDEDEDLNQFSQNKLISSSSEDENTTLGENNFSKQSKKRKFFEPRYVSEILPSDFSSPKSAKRTIDLIKNIDLSKSQKIKQLQRQTKSLQKKIQSLHDLINHLKENRLLTDESGDGLIV
ncbi:uncharacterized protein LOC103569873 [Microplitis demolitor]|uniref:uncharacterized protein LOC103569873 n=1 Tax=Microplitis demolitor TaxID=69319 RepID=UPI0004CCF3F4|nr:uncharacterized protein LOC103569873 [Microplitis demolitor]